MTDWISHARMVERTKAALGAFQVGRVLAEGDSDVGRIQMFTSPDPGRGFHIANADILVLDRSGRPYIVAEPERTMTPKSYGRSILVYTTVKSLKTRTLIKPIDEPLGLLIVVPDGDKVHKRREQLRRVQTSLESPLRLEETSLRRFVICQVADLDGGIRNLLDEQH